MILARPWDNSTLGLPVLQYKILVCVCAPELVRLIGDLKSSRVPPDFVLTTGDGSGPSIMIITDHPLILSAPLEFVLLGGVK